jgi:putative membrane protein
MQLRSLSILLVAVLVSVGAFAQQSQKPAQQQSNPQQQSMTPDKAVSGMNPNAEKPSSNNPTNRPDDADEAFLKKAAIGDAAEVQLGQMAEQKASNPKVKGFGQRMVKDHSQNDDLLTSVAEEQHIPLPTELDPEHKNAKDALSKKNGTQFDQNYMTMMVHEHQKTVAMFQHEAQTSQDQTIKQFAKSSLPTLQSHLQEAQQIESQLNAGK